MKSHNGRRTGGEVLRGAPAASSRLAKLLCGILPLVLGYALIALWPVAAAESPVFFVANVTASCAFFATGALVSVEREHRATGWAVMAAGVVWPLNWVNEWMVGPLPLIAALDGPLASFLALWGLLRYPVRWPGPWWDRGVAAVLAVGQLAAVAVVVLSVPEWHDLPPSTPWLTLHADRAAFRIVTEDVYQLGGALISVLAALTVTIRFARLGSLDRRMMSPAMVAIVGATLAAAASNLGASARFESVEHRLSLLEAIAVTVIPLGLLLAAVTRWLSRGDLPKRVAEVRRARTAGELETALRHALGDPSLAVLYRDGDGYVDVDGRDTPPPAGPRPLELRSAGGDLLGVVITVTAMGRHSNVVEPVLRTAAMVIENTRLQTLVLARIGETTRSTERVVRAVELEARRIASSLDSTALRRLAAAVDRLDALARTARPEVAELLETARDETCRVMQDLHELAQGRPPTVLRKHGLAAALLARPNARVTVRIPARRFDAETEAAAYFTTSELVANSLKHAGAAARILVWGRSGSGTLRIIVEDDGCGGADPEGAGLLGVTSRLHRLGGEIELLSPPGSGTRAIVTLPLLR